MPEDYTKHLEKRIKENTIKVSKKISKGGYCYECGKKTGLAQGYHRKIDGKNCLLCGNCYYNKKKEIKN